MTTFRKAGTFVCLLTGAVASLTCSPAQEDPSRSAIHCRTLSFPPVLFIHGSGLDSSSWATMVSSLTQLGYPPEYLRAVDLKPNDGGNITAATLQIPVGMNALIESSQREFESSECEGSLPSKTVVVAHSMGAVSGRWYASRIEPENVMALIAIAGANHGTDALCGLIGEGNAEMCPAYSDDSRKNKVQVELNGTPERPVDETPFGIGVDGADREIVPADASRQILYLTIRIEPDEWISPADSATLDGAGGWMAPDFSELPISETSEGNFILHTGTSHDSMPDDPAIIEFVFNVLEYLAVKP